MRKSLGSLGNSGLDLLNLPGFIRKCQIIPQRFKLSLSLAGEVGGILIKGEVLA